MRQDTPDIITLRAGNARLSVAPTVGGSMTRYMSEREGRTFDWMRPAPPEAIANHAANEMANFPLVPFSNRIKDGAFKFRGRVIQLDQNFGPEPHAIHGHGWQQPWIVTALADSTLTIEYRHPAGAWPWAYRAEQIFNLTAEQLTVRFAVTNESSNSMPVGFGLHPYFIRTPLATIRANVGSMWQADSNSMPDTRVPPPPQLLLGGVGLNPNAIPLDNNFVRFGGEAVIDWPEWNARLRISTDPIYRCLVIYTPPERDFFCVEPATNCIDGFNLSDAGETDTGLIVIEPNDTTAGDTTFTVEHLPD